MSLPIKETPILSGKDAERFEELMQQAESPTPEQIKHNSIERDRCLDIYHKVIKKESEHE